MDDHTGMAPVSQRGLTLVECLLAVTLLGILVTLAPGHLHSLLTSHRLESSQHQLRALLAKARSEALTRNRAVTLCSTKNGKQCAGTRRTGSRAWEGALLFVDLDQDRMVGTGETVFYVANFHPAVNIVWNRGDSLIYRSNGTVLGGSNGTFTLRTEGADVERRIVVSLLGRIRTEEIAL